MKQLVELVLYLQSRLDPLATSLPTISEILKLRVRRPVAILARSRVNWARSRGARVACSRGPERGALDEAAKGDR